MKGKQALFTRRQRIRSAQPEGAEAPRLRGTPWAPSAQMWSSPGAGGSFAAEQVSFLGPPGAPLRCARDPGGPPHANTPGGASLLAGASFALVEVRELPASVPKPSPCVPVTL